MEPNADQAAGRELLATVVEKFAGEQIRHAGNPQARRLRDDDVVAARGKREVVAAVADDHPRARVGERVLVDLAKEFGRLHDLGRQLDAVNGRDQVALGRAQADAAAEADQQHLLGILVQEQRQVRQKRMRAQILALRGGDDFAVDPHKTLAAQVPHGHRRGHAFLGIEQAAALPNGMGHALSGEAGRALILSGVEVWCAVEQGHVPSGEARSSRPGANTRNSGRLNRPSRQRK